jgi:GntR family transcriptional repressor for pyruvate dehydrogenase complex
MTENTEKNVNSIPQIPKISVAKATFDFLLSNIMHGTWKRGEKIPSENELRVSLNVSRHTIRQAIANLNMLGILETKQGDGNYVRQVGVGLYADFLLPDLIFNKDSVAQIVEFRESIEVASAYYAALRATDEDLKQIKEKMEICVEKRHDITNYPSYDLDFHTAIAAASKNELLYQSLSVIKKHCFDAIREYFDSSLAEQGADCHQKIYDAILHRDADAAKAHMWQHMKNILDRVNNERFKQDK